ncbi:MAG: ribosome-associated translation inhibitor RaiA [Caldilineaceae bacterium]|nr:ribosome-associated translation inhibitor RaiA [Caldilineaceae bacterium]
MELTVHGRHLEVTDWIRQYIEKKVNRLERYLPQVQELRAELTQSETKAAADRYTAQITLWANGQILRAEESTSDIFASIDASIDKMANQLQRFKGRRFQSRRRAAAAASMEAEMNDQLPATQEGVEDEEDAGSILRRKQFVLEPMNEEEALEQMELLGHDFFVFFNPDVKAVNVVYRRRDGNYGLLQPMIA